MKKSTCFVSLLICLSLLVGSFLLLKNSVPVVYSKNDERFHIAEQKIIVKKLCQYPSLPTGCESVSATMVLNYYGDRVSSEDFAAYWLDCGSFSEQDGVTYGPNPYVQFAGDPFSEYAYGCYPPVIVNAVNNNSYKCFAQAITGATLEELCYSYIDNNEPVLIWATMYMNEPQIGDTWCLDDGSSFTWTFGEHCMVLVGYDDYYYFFNDPIEGGVVAYEKSLSQQRFEEMGSQAVYITKY